MITIQDMCDGYFDGLHDDRPEYPEQSNRSEVYRHGWHNGRDDRVKRPRASADVLRVEADRVLGVSA